MAAIFRDPSLMWERSELNLTISSIAFEHVKHSRNGQHRHFFQSKSKNNLVLFFHSNSLRHSVILKHFRKRGRYKILTKKSFTNSSLRFLFNQSR